MATGENVDPHILRPFLNEENYGLDLLGLLKKGSLHSADKLQVVVRVIGEQSFYCELHSIGSLDIPAVTKQGRDRLRLCPLI